MVVNRHMLLGPLLVSEEILSEEYKREYPCEDDHASQLQQFGMFFIGTKCCHPITPNSVP